MITVPNRYGQTDGQTISNLNTALCTKVHRAVKTHTADIDATCVIYYIDVNGPSATTKVNVMLNKKYSSKVVVLFRNFY